MQLPYYSRRHRRRLCSCIILRNQPILIHFSIAKRKLIEATHTHTHTKTKRNIDPIKPLIDEARNAGLMNGIELRNFGNQIGVKPITSKSVDIITKVIAVFVVDFVVVASLLLLQAYDSFIRSRQHFSECCPLRIRKRIETIDCCFPTMKRHTELQ